MAVSRVIEVSFGRSSVALVRIDTAYFYNNGILFKPTDIDLPASYQVHWADSPQSTSTLETIGTAEGAPIPDDLWNRSRVIYGWIYLHPTEDSGVTAYEVRIYKNVRAGLPDGTEPTPAEQSTIDQLISALNSAVEQTGEDAESAEQARDDAITARNNAQGFAENAQSSAQASASSAESASQSAQTASEKATASAQSASQSAQIKADVEELVDDAQGYANSASQSASQASASEQGCARAVLDAASAAAIARARADEASGYAQTASTKATEASTSAQTASQKATESAQSASQALTYKTDAESAKADAESARDEAQQAVASISGALDDKAPVITDTASGSIASFSDGADDLPLKSLVVDINPIQDLSHGNPSPENICPISGWTGANVTRCGKNVFDASTFFAANGGTLQPDGSYYIDNPNTIYNKVFWSNPNTYEGQLAITFIRKTEASKVSTRLVVKYTDGTNQKVGSMAGTGSFDTYTFITASDKVVSEIVGDYGSSYPSYVYVQIEVGTTATNYEPYTGRSITINLGQTVYGGKLDVLSGKLVIDRAMVDLGSLTWQKIDSYEGVFIAGIQGKADGAFNLICSAYATSSVGSAALMPDCSIVANNRGAITFVKDISKASMTAAGFKEAVSGFMCCYEIASPITIQLTPNQVNSLLGVNNIWADSGDTTAEYRADTKLFIERLTAPDSADMIADANITSGQYFMVGNSLYKATANIANGSAIVVGTNCIRKSLSEALNEINV